MLVNHLLKPKKKLKNLKKQESQDIFIETSKTKLVFNTIRFMVILKMFLEKQVLINYYVINLLILLKILNVIGIKEV